MSDGKKILDDLEKGKLPDIKTGSGKQSKDLIRVRYNKSDNESVWAPAYKTNRNFSVFSVDKQKKQGQKVSNFVTKDRKKEKTEKQ